MSQNLAITLMNKKNWAALFALVSAISIAGLIYLGGATYTGSPPLENFKAANGDIVISREAIKGGEEVFHLRGLMSWGSFWGDGGERGPDFTADALHRTAMSMREFYAQELGGSTSQYDTLPQYDKDAIAARVIRELHANTYDEESGFIGINDAEIYAFEELNKHYTRMFTDASYEEAFSPAGYISEPDQLRDLTAFFFWGGWVSSSNRPGENYSYTHNWPGDKDAGNTPTDATFMWSVFSIFALIFGIGAVLYVYGQMKEQPVDVFEGGDDNGNGQQSLTTYDLENEYVRPTQRATYKFFMLAIIVFGVQILAGIIIATDFVRPFGMDLNELIPFTVARSYHTLLQIYWFFMCWVGYTIFFLPRISKVPPGQKGLIDLLFALCVITGAGAIFGIYLGQTGVITGSMAYWFGSQGWEFMELGRFFQFTLLTSFALWILIIYRGVKPWLTTKNMWSVPSWLLYGSGIMVAFLFFGLMIQPEMNFAISDYWRWMVVHMWVEVTFEVFTTVIIGYMLVQMGLITRLMAERVIYLAVMLFLITATIGISHNFYWIAKPTGIIALGSVFSTLQVLPLLLLTLDAWQMRQEGNSAEKNRVEGKQTFVMEGVWLFILGVNFWNIFGAGVFGSLINLPIVNYYEHATYLTGNHAHAAMFGVKGNIALGGMLFCCQHLFTRTAWNAKLVKTAFWSMNIGLAMMMFMDLFWVGLYQTYVAFAEGTWMARSQEIVTGPVFVYLTSARALGGLVFIWGGLLPMMWFILSRGNKLRLKEEDVEEGEWTVYDKDWS
ncbi:MAG TPA: cbb3-type cytochrome c oxidase subunit I, partial [Pseudomonadales bacterium]|nr:cbb3-type cytochrome c oxidase subunit I [Pseudomonadales bacterium]